MSVATPPPLLPGMRICELVMGKQLGAGGFGTVHLASHGPRRLAVKFLNLRRVGAWRWREADLLNRLEHPNVVRFLGCGYHPLEAPRFFYIVMEYVEGRRLDRWADAENPTARRAVQVLAQLARALEAVHGVGALHRDLKEANVMVGAGDHVTLIDFGMGGHAGAAPVTPLGLVPGTPDYQPPEAWEYRRAGSSRRESVPYEATALHDLWALGVVHYRLLVGQRPYVTDWPEGVNELLAGRCRTPREANARVPEALSALCMRLLARTPEQRFQSAGEVRAALEALLVDVGPEWDVPLCMAYAPDNLTTEDSEGKEDGEAQLLRWVRAPLRPPRRGPRPPREGRREAPARPDAVLPAPVEAAPVEAAPVEAALVEAAPVEAAPVEAAPVEAAPGVRPPREDAAPPPLAGGPPLPPAVSGVREASLRPEARGAPVQPAPGAAPASPGSPRARRPGRGLPGLGLLVAALAVFAGLLLARERPAPEAAGREMAPAGKALEAGRAVATPAAPPQDDTAMKPDDTPAPSQTKPRAQRLGPVTRAVGAAASCLAMACGGGPGGAAQVRPAPPLSPADCPDGAVAAMEKLDIDVGDTSSILFRGDYKYADVRLGWQTLRMHKAFGDLPLGTLLSGRLTAGGWRVYGRFTEARLPGGRAFPVCIEVEDPVDGEAGLALRESSTPAAPRVLRSVDLRAVERFR